MNELRLVKGGMPEEGMHLKVEYDNEVFHLSGSVEQLSVMNRMIEETADTIESYEEELTELRRDKARLDWIHSALKDGAEIFVNEDNETRVWFRDGTSHSEDSCWNIREAIDSAMETENEA